MVKSEKREFLLLLIFGAIILLAANGSLAITDPVESNYALTAKEMVASGDYLSPRIFGNYWYDKPAFFYWEMIASCLIFGVNEFALRFPSAVMGLLSLTLLYFFARRLYGHRTALLAGGLFGHPAREIAALLLLNLLCLLFVMSIGILTRGKRSLLIALLLPLLLLSLIGAPVFLDLGIRALELANPLYYYLKFAA